MSDEAAFLRAILDDPDDDAPRLVFADWLEEQGDAPRAEFIRVQCRLARLTEDDEGFWPAEDRSNDLQMAHSAEWLAPFTSLGRQVFCHFERGFVVLIEGVESLDGGLTCLSSAPLLERLHLTNTEVVDDQLVALAGLTNLRVLDICGCHVSPAALGHLVELPYLFMLVTDLDGHAISRFRLERAAAFASWPVEHKRRVVRSFSRWYFHQDVTCVIDTSDSGVGDDFASLLPALPEVRDVVLDNCQVTGSGLPYLAAMPGLERLFLAGNPVNDLSGLAGQTRLRELHLGRVPLLGRVR